MSDMSVLELAVRRGGLWKGARAAEVIVAWAIAEQELGHELGGGAIEAGVREYAEYWKQSERTAWRELRRFREVFREDQTPARLARLVRAAAANGALDRESALLARVATV